MVGRRRGNPPSRLPMTHSHTCHPRQLESRRKNAGLGICSGRSRTPPLQDTLRQPPEIRCHQSLVVTFAHICEQLFIGAAYVDGENRTSAVDGLTGWYAWNGGSAVGGLDLQRISSPHSRSQRETLRYVACTALQLDEY